MSSVRKPSLFAQKMQKLRAAQDGRNRETVLKECDSPLSRFGERSYVVSGEEAEVIHQENIAKLSSMSEDEILETRRELLGCLKSKNIEFLKKRRKKESTSDLQSSFTSLSTNELPDVVVELKRKNLHMDKVEPEKLKWMENVPNAPQPLPNSLYNARFDFEGDLLPYVEENKSTCERGLYHHGEEPHRPGYTIEELYQLSRSSVIPQRIVALNTLAAILEKEFILSSCLETELLNVLLDSGLFLILRFSLDDKLPSVYLAALRGISSLFWKPVDMHYLSDMVGVFGDLRLPSLSVVDETLTSESINEIKDVDLIKLDVIKGALRTDIVQRFRYIIDNPLLEVDHFLFIIRCLTRFCYHSDETVIVIMNTPSLLEILFANCQFNTKPDKLYIPKLMVLFRVIACRSQKFAHQLQSRLNLIPFLLGVINDSVTKTTTVSQCLCLWHVFLHYGIGVDSINQFTPLFFTLLKQLYGLHVNNLKTGIISYATTLITLLHFLMKRYFDCVKFLIPTADELCCQWLHIVVIEKHIPREFLKLASNAVFLLCSLPQTHLAFFPAKIKSFFPSATYDTFSEKLKQCSFLLNGNKRNLVPSLPSLNVPAAILNTHNDLLLVHSAVKYCLILGTEDVARGVLNNHLWDYVTAVLEHSKLAEVSNSWSARYEIYFLCDIIDVCIRWKIFVDRRLLQLAFVLVRIIHIDDANRIEKIFSEIIFNDSIYREIIMNHSDSDALFHDLDSMEQFFAREVNLPKTGVDLMSTIRGSECALSTDWYYIPILKISNSKDGSIDVDVDAIRSVLRWIYLLETLSDEIKTDMSLAARYCRVSCIFLCGNVFLEVSDILYDILCEMLKHNDKLNFKTPIPGISSFYDFYRELCEQFVSSSYCNPVFGAYMLVPLQQKHDCELRRFIWNEQPIAFRFLNVAESQLPIPIRCFLEPCETNLNLVETYLRTIATGRILEKYCPILFHVGVHHVATFMKKFETEMAAQKLKQKVETIGNEELRNKFIYHTYDSN